MRFIPKQKEVLIESVELKETDANPLDAGIVDSSKDELYKQAILKAIGSETAADVEYSQILNLEDNVSEDLKNRFHDTLVDIRNEEIKHIAQLTEKVSELPDMKDAFEAGKKEAETGEDTEINEDKSVEEVKEAVEKERLYNRDKIIEIVAEYIDDNIDSYLDLEKIFNIENTDLTAEQVDNFLLEVVNRFNLSFDQLHDIEVKIVQTTDPVYDRIEDLKQNVDLDIYKLQSIKKELYSQRAKEKLTELIDDLEIYLDEINTKPINEITV